ncbi:uncharacterized protein LOC110019895 isoform X4 [Phalaenopsis equestris]|uniref:uncharacterized protein LOC110019895 isoform X4 n=1 Tax=Phalaenopsis equestris TaxID=78828 RepID=UPI0009E3F418|nr:uncharacterized protein LOC110019895 isoform X4 [Phalaenopsis equestris]
MVQLAEPLAEQTPPYVSSSVFKLFFFFSSIAASRMLKHKAIPLNLCFLISFFWSWLLFFVASPSVCPSILSLSLPSAQNAYMLLQPLVAAIDQQEVRTGDLNLTSKSSRGQEASRRLGPTKASNAFTD